MSRSLVHNQPKIYLYNYPVMEYCLVDPKLANPQLGACDKLRSKDSID
jgi:hypothetical protein